MSNTIIGIQAIQSLIESFLIINFRNFGTLIIIENKQYERRVVIYIYIFWLILPYIIGWDYSLYVPSVTPSLIRWAHT